MKRFLVFLSFSLLFTLCGCREEPVRIGSKPFTEQSILAEIIAQLCEQEGIPVKRLIPYGSTFSCLQGTREGKLDLYVEYSGTALTFLGYPAVSDGDEAYAQVKEKFQSLGLEWQERLGFHNDYVLLMRRDQAAALGAEKISDLSAVGTELRFGCEAEFTRRPLDGYKAMLRHYGVNNVVAPRLLADKPELYRALLEKEIDVAVGYSTDGQIKDYDLLALEDDMGFFPVYEAAPLVRAETLAAYPKLGPTLQKLAGLIDTETMLEMNRQVELEGRNYRVVAREFLKDRGLLPREEKKRSHSKKLHVAVDTLDESGGMAGHTLMAVRKAFPKRRVELIASAQPRKLLEDGQARLAVLGAETFFRLDADRLPVKLENVEAIAPVGYRMCHLVTTRELLFTADTESRQTLNAAAVPASLKAAFAEHGHSLVENASVEILRQNERWLIVDDEAQQTYLALTSEENLCIYRESANRVLSEMLKIGVGPENGCSHAVAQILTGALGRKGVTLVPGETASQLELLASGELDGLLLMARPEHTLLTAILSRPEFRLASLQEWHRSNHVFRYPYLRLSRIPAHTYEYQRNPVETIATQVVLAALRPNRKVVGDTGPVTARIEAQSLARVTVLQLTAELDSDEIIDPLLPTSEHIEDPEQVAQKSLAPSYEGSLLNALVIAALIYLMYLFFREEKQAPIRQES